MTPEHLQKIADALRGKRHHHRSHKQTAEAREKIGAAHRGKHVSAETRAKMSAAHYGKSCPQRFGRMTPGRERVVRPTTRDIHWLAGFYEGEGCCIRSGSRHRAGGGTTAGTPTVYLYQVDIEPLRKAQSLFGGSIWQGTRRGSPYRTCLHWQCTGVRARGVLLTIYSLLSERRQAQARAALAIPQS